MIRIKLSANNLFYIIFCMAVIIAACKVQNKITSTGLSDNPQLKELVRIDQQMRQSDTVVEMEPIDKQHRAVVMSLLATGQIKTNTDKFNASLILQHTALTFCNGKLVSISPENYLLAYQLAKSAFESGDKSAAYMTAATYDRYLLYTEGYQKYGTQRVPDEATGEEVWAPIDPKTTDEERAKYNVPPLTELLKKYKMKPFPNSK
jgi:hypothetical protein